MRTKDDKKQEALFLATIKVVNEIGFAASSVSKIAKEACVSPATLYVYFKNKEDLLVSTYLEIKYGMSVAMLEGYDADLPVRDIVRRVWHNAFHHVKANVAEFKYSEQFSNSPYTELIDQKRLQANFQPIMETINRGINEKIIKDVSIEVLSAFLFQPILVLANPNHCKSFKPSDKNIESAFQMAWDALKL